MNLITALEIATNYPNGDILIECSQYKDTQKWTSLMYLLRCGRIHKLMLSFDRNEKFAGWDTEKEAKEIMENVRDSAIKYINDNHRDLIIEPDPFNLQSKK